MCVFFVCVFKRSPLLGGSEGKPKRTTTISDGPRKKDMPILITDVAKMRRSKACVLEAATLG